MFPLRPCSSRAFLTEGCSRVDARGAVGGPCGRKRLLWFAAGSRGGSLGLWFVESVREVGRGETSFTWRCCALGAVGMLSRVGDVDARSFEGSNKARRDGWICASPLLSCGDLVSWA